MPKMKMTQMPLIAFVTTEVFFALLFVCTNYLCLCVWWSECEKLRK